MAHRHERLDAVLGAFVEHLVVKRQARLVGLGLITVGEDAAPGDRHAIHLEAHLGVIGDVLFVTMVEVGAEALGVGGVIGGGERLVDQLISDVAQAVDIHELLEGLWVGELLDIGGGRPLAVEVPRTLALVGGGGAAPQEALGEGL